VVLPKLLRMAMLAGCAGLGLGATAAPAAVRDFRMNGFDKVDLAAAATVQVRSGGGFAVRADGDDDLIRRLDIRVRQGTLVIAWLPNEAPRTLHNQHLTIAVTMPRIAGASVSGAGTVTVDRVEAPDFAGRVGGAGTLRIGALKAGQASLDVGGAGQLEVAGTANRLVAHLSGVGSIKAGALAARAGLIDMSGTSSVAARVNGPVEVKLSGVGSVTVLGQPQCVVRKSGWGSVRCGTYR
jgi:hypothetical protein